MSSVVVTGANRGIGLGLVRHLLSDPSVAIVIATARDVDSAKDLQALSCPKLQIIQLEVTNEDSIANAAKEVFEIVGENGLDVLINNAGVIGVKMPLNDPVSKANLAQTLDVNAIAPLLIANKFYPLLKKASSKKGWAQIAMISSTGASLEISQHMGMEQPFIGYFMSKSALNMLTRRIAVERKEDNIRAITFCPGSVKTDMNPEHGRLTVDESTFPLTKLILSLTEEHNGQFFRYNVEKIPW